MIRRRNLPGLNQGGASMINNPVIVPASTETGAMAVRPADPYFSIMVDTCELDEPTEIILFDAGRGYQLGFERGHHVDTKITGLTTSYEYLLNDVAHNGSYFDTMQMTVTRCVSNTEGSTNGNCCDLNSFALTQYGFPIEVYESSKGGRPRHIDTIYPSKGINESQHHLQINTFQHPVLVDGRIALVYKQLPGTIITWKFFQRAEFGRIK